MSTLSVGDLQGLAVNSNVVTVPTGHTLNAVDGLQIGGVGVGTWQPWSPTVTFSTGSTTTTVASANYCQIENLVFWQAVITWAAVGTASGLLQITTPVTAATSTAHTGSGLDGGPSLDSVWVYLSSATQLAARFYDGSSITSKGSYAIIRISGSYEAA
jgi:hypothetical protein